MYDVRVSTLDWAREITIHGEDLLRNLGEEEAKNIIGRLPETSVLQKICQMLFDQRMFVTETDLYPGLFLQPNPLFGPMTVYGAIRWAWMHGFQAFPLVEYEQYAQSVTEPGRYICPDPQLIGTAQLDGYRVFRQRGHQEPWLSDYERIDQRDCLLVKPQSLTLLSVDREENIYKLKAECKMDLESIRDTLWLRELEGAGMVSPLSKGDIIQARRSNLTNCSRCYGRGSKQPLAPFSQPPRETCPTCKGTGRVKRKLAA